MQRFALVRWLVIVSLMTAACGKKAEDESAQEAAATAPRDACTLLNEQDVAAVHGAPVTAKRESRGADYSSCEFTDPAKQDYFVMGIEVYWRGGKSEWNIGKTATAGAVRLLDHAEESADAKAVIDQNPAAGLGDQATFSDIMGGNVLKGDTLIGFKFGIMKDPDAHFRPLAEKALSRL